MEEQREQEVQEIKKKMGEVLELNEVEELLKTNEKVFDFDGVTYRIRKPSFKQKQEAYQKRVERFTELLSNSKYLLEVDLKKLYLSRGIDIDQMNRDILMKVNRRDSLMVQLGEAIKNKAADPDLLSLKGEVESINTDIQTLSIKKTMLLETSIEQQVGIYTYTYLSFLIAEKLNKETNEWVRVWTSFEEFEHAPEGLINLVSYYTTLFAGE